MRIGCERDIKYICVCACTFPRACVISSPRMRAHKTNTHTYTRTPAVAVWHVACNAVARSPHHRINAFNGTVGGGGGGDAAGGGVWSSRLMGSKVSATMLMCIVSIVATVRQSGAQISSECDSSHPVTGTAEVGPTARKRVMMASEPQNCHSDNGRRRRRLAEVSDTWWLVTTYRLADE